MSEEVPENVTEEVNVAETEAPVAETEAPIAETEAPVGVDETENANGDAEIVQEEHIPEFQSFLDAGLDHTVACSIEQLCNSGGITAAEFVGKPLETIKDFTTAEALDLLKDLSGSTLTHVSNKIAYVCGLMKTYRQRKASHGTSHVPSVGATKKYGPDEAKMKEILDRTGYSMEITTGQRKYGGPPPGWEGPPPGAGHEIFIGKLPRDVYEDDLIPLLESSGQLYDLRIMMDSTTGSGGNRGYAFAMFLEKEGAKRAVEKLDGYEIRPGKKLKANVSVANVRLFVGNIPKSKSKDEIMEMFSSLTENLTEVIIYSTPDDPKKKNRGFAFLEYSSHKDASVARRKLTNGQVRVWNCEIIVDWAEPQDEPDEKTMQAVKVVYVRNLKNEVTEDELKQSFEPYGTIERVRKLKDYGFIHFENRDCALKAIEELNGKTLHGAPMTVQLAKPPSEHKKDKKQQPAGGGSGSYGDDYWPAALPPPRPVPLSLLPRRLPRPGLSAAARIAALAAYDYEYDSYDYGGGYADDYYGGYDDSSYYDDYYGGYVPPPPRPRGRAGIIPPLASLRARGAASGRPGPRGALPGIRGRGAGARGGAAGAGGRGGRGVGRGGAANIRGGAGGARGGAKRKAFGGDQQQASKKRNTNNAGWGSQPIAQQPLGDDQKWYQDTYGSSSWN